MQARFEEISQLTDAFCQTYLNDEYQKLCRELMATLCRKCPSPLGRGKATVWACGIIHALGLVNFLFDSSQMLSHLRQEVVFAKERLRQRKEVLQSCVVHALERAS